MKRLILFLCTAVSSLMLVTDLSGQAAEPAFIQIDSKLGKVVYHRVLANQTLYGIGKIYGVGESDLIQSNPKLKRNRKKLPPVIRVPIRSDQLLLRVPLLKSKSDFTAVYYVAKKKDNPFRISRVIFDMPTNLLIKRNNIRNNQIKEGQTLHIGWLKQEREPLLVRVGREAPTLETKAKSDEQSLFEEQLELYSVISKNQVAFWNQDAKTKGLFVMHRKAPAKSIIEIKNPMYNKVAYAKVIGNLPEHLYSKEIDMVVSPALAQELGVVDAKFFVQVRYPSNESIGSR